MTPLWVNIVLVIGGFMAFCFMAAVFLGVIVTLHTKRSQEIDIDLERQIHKFENYGVI